MDKPVFGPRGGTAMAPMKGLGGEFSPNHDGVGGEFSGIYVDGDCAGLINTAGY